MVDDRPLHRLPRKLRGLRHKLLREETRETFKALREQDLAAVLQEITDIQYVLDGLYLTLGLHELKDAAFAEVHRANMSKLMPDGTVKRREDGKVLKGPNFSPPDLRPIIDQYLKSKELGLA